MADLRRRRGEGDAEDLLEEQKEEQREQQQQLSDSATADSSDHVSLEILLMT